MPYSGIPWARLCFVGLTFALRTSPREATRERLIRKHQLKEKKQNRRKKGKRDKRERRKENSAEARHRYKTKNGLVPSRQSPIGSVSRDLIYKKSRLRD